MSNRWVKHIFLAEQTYLALYFGLLCDLAETGLVVSVEPRGRQLCRLALLPAVDKGGQQGRGLHPLAVARAAGRGTQNLIKHWETLSWRCFTVPCISFQPPIQQTNWKNVFKMPTQDWVYAGLWNFINHINYSPHHLPQLSVGGEGRVEAAGGRAALQRGVASPHWPPAAVACVM